MRSRCKTLAGLALLAAGPALVAGCGAKTVPIDAAAVLAAVPQKTATASTAKVTIDTAVTAKSGAAARPIHVGMNGAIDLRSNNGTFEIDAGSLGVPGFSGNITARKVGGAMYMNIDALAASSGPDVSAILGNKHWLKIVTSKVAPAGTALRQDPGSFTQSLQYLRGVDKNGVKTLGKETVRGTETTHYQADVDLALLRKQLGTSDLTPDVKRLMEQGLNQFSTKSFRLDVWVDSDGRMRRQHMDLPVQAGTSVSMTLDLYDFGVKVQASAPPADQVLDMSELQALAQTHPNA
ncbi:MAG: hypothetical protein JWL83_3813 [Actinomycetia bacterium]|nr:hypothetical protein [Actinomycetes bacterium]